MVMKSVKLCMIMIFNRKIIYKVIFVNSTQCINLILITY